MAEGINLVVLSGNVGADPTFKQFENGAVLNFRMATTSSYVDRNNARQEVTDWHNVVVNGAKRAAALNDIIKKGTKVTVTGNIKTRSYEQDGVKKYVTEIRADKIVLSGGGAPKEDASFDTEKLSDPSTQGIEDDQP